MARGCCDCTWRCPLFDSERCAPCRYNLNKPNFESEAHPGYGTKAAAEVPIENEHKKAFRELVEKNCPTNFTPYVSTLQFPYVFDYDPFDRED